MLKSNKYLVIQERFDEKTKLIIADPFCTDELDLNKLSKAESSQMLLQNENTRSKKFKLSSLRLRETLIIDFDIPLADKLGSDKFISILGRKINAEIEFKK